MKVFKRVRKKVCPFIMAVFVLFGSVVSVYPVHAASVGGLTAAEIAGYVLSITGAVNMLSGGGIGKLGGSIVTSLENKVSELLGNGIYEDGNGNLVFTGSATQALYDAMDSNSNIDARAVSNFGGVNPNSSLFFASSPYTSTAFKVHLIPNAELSDVSGFDDYLYYLFTDEHNGYLEFYLRIYDVSDVSYLAFAPNSTSLSFYNASGNAISCIARSYDMNYNYQSGSFSNVYYRGTPSFSGIGLSSGPRNTFWAENDITLPSDTNDYVDFYYNNFPFNFGSGGLFYCNKSLIVGKTSAYANSLANKTSGTIFSNNYTVLPSINKTVLENNNWDSIYNSYVTNVNNNQQYFYDDTNGTWDVEALREYMKQYSDNIVNAVNDGIENIADAVNYTNEWLSKIYDRLGQILDQLDVISTDDPSGGDGGGSSGSDVDLSEIEETLNSIDYNVNGMAPEIHQLLQYIIALDGKMSTNLTDNARIYALMGQILTAIQQIKLGPTNVTINPRSPDTPDPFADWDDYFKDLDDSDLEDVISPWDTLYQLIKGSAPLCYVLFLDELVTSLDVTPVEPIFTIPVKLQNNYIDIDEEIEVDLTIFDSIIPMIKGLILIVFTISLIWASWEIIPLFGALFDV